MKLEDLVTESISKELSQDARDKIVNEYINRNIDLTGHRVKDNVLNVLTVEINKELEKRRDEISILVTTAFDEAIKDKGLIQTIIYKKRLRVVAESILRHV